MYTIINVAVGIRLKINNNISLNRDLGEFLLNALYTNLIKNDLTKYYKKTNRYLHTTFQK